MKIQLALDKKTPFTEKAPCRIEFASLSVNEEDNASQFSIYVEIKTNDGETADIHHHYFTPLLNQFKKDKSTAYFGSFGELNYIEIEPSQKVYITLKAIEGYNTLATAGILTYSKSNGL